MEEFKKEDETTQVTNTETQEPKEVEFSEVELDAQRLGWTTKEEWEASGRNPKDWRPADVWMDRGQLMGTISSLRHEINQLKPQIGEAFKMGRKMAEASFKEEIDRLKEAKKEALGEHDFIKAEELQDKIDETKERAQVELSKTSTPRSFEPPPEYGVFLKRNPWYLSDDVLRGAADAIGAKFLKANANTATPADLYFHVEESMKERFPGLYGPKNTPKGPVVETGGSNLRGGDTKKSSFSSLKSGMSDFERSIMKNVIASTPGMTEDKYLQEYSKVK